MIEKLYLVKGNMFVLKTPRVFEWYTILAVGVDMYWNQLVRVRKWNKDKSFKTNYSYDLNISNFANDDSFNDFLNQKNSKKFLEQLDKVFWY